MADCDSDNVLNNSKLPGETILNNQTTHENKTEKVMEPMLLLEESTAEEFPQTLKNLLSYFKQNNERMNEFDVIVVFVYIVMLESGFVPLEAADVDVKVYDFHYPRVVSLTKKMPKNWKSNGVYTLEFVVAMYPQHVCKVTCVSGGEELILNYSLSGIKLEPYCTLIDPSLYVIDKYKDIVPSNVQHLKEFSYKLKSEVCGVAKVSILNTQFCRAPTLYGLPLEILYIIIQYLDRPSVENLGRTTNILKCVCDRVHLNTLQQEQQQFRPIGRFADVRRVFRNYGLWPQNAPIFGWDYVVQ